jgi:hypothetical protein
VFHGPVTHTFDIAVLARLEELDKSSVSVVIFIFIVISYLGSVGLRRTGTPGLFAYSLAGQNTNPFQLCEDEKRLVQFLHEGTGKDSRFKFGEILSSSFYPYVAFFSGTVLV